MPYPSHSVIYSYIVFLCSAVMEVPSEDILTEEQAWYYYRDIILGIEYCKLNGGILLQRKIICILFSGFYEYVNKRTISPVKLQYKPLMR